MLIFCYAKISSFETTKVLPKSCQVWIFVQLACFSCPGEFLNFVEKNSNTKKTNKKNKDLACFVFVTFLSWNLTLGLNLLRNDLLKEAFLKVQKIYPFTLLCLALFSCLACCGQFHLVSFLTSYKKRWQKSFSGENRPFCLMVDNILLISFK